MSISKNKKHSLGSATVEYSLVMAITITIVVAAAQAMNPNMEAFFESAANKIESFLGGGSSGSNSTSGQNTATPELESNAAARETAAQLRAAAGGGEDSGGGGFWSGVWGATKQVGGVFKGFGEQAVDTVVGLGTLAYDLSVLTSPVTYFVDPDRHAAVRDKYAQVGQAIWNNPGDVAYAIVEPIVTDWKNGNYGEAIGRGTFEAVTIVFTPTKLGKAGKIGDVAEDVASAARAADRVDDLGDAGSVAGRVTRTIDEILPDGKVPSNRNGEFNRWFDELSPEEFNTVWADDAIRTQIERRVRYPGGLHEWCMVCRAPTFKEWGVSMDDIKRFRTGTDDLKWIDPDTGLPGGHKIQPGSEKFHRELKDIIDNSSSLEEFNRRTVELRDRWQIDPELLPPLIEG